MEKELDLVRQAKAGDVSAFAKLYEQVYEDMYRYAFYMLQHTQDAQDAVSDTVADAFASIRKLRGEEAFRGWIFAILSNKCRRKRKEYTIYVWNFCSGDPFATIFSTWVSPTR